jgi:O-antigen ligase
VWVALPLARLRLMSIGGQAVEPADALLVLAYVLALARLLAGWRPTVDRGYLTAAVALLAALALSLIVAGGRAGAWLKLGAHAAQCGTPLLTLALVDSPARFAALVRAAVIGLAMAVAATLASVAAFYVLPGAAEVVVCTWGALPPRDLVPRVCWPLRNPNLLASYLAAVAPLVLLLPLPSSRAAPGRASLPALALLVSAALTFSTQVGGLGLGLALGLRARLGLRGPRAAILLGGAGLLALLLGLAVTSYVVDGRLHLWQGPRVSVWRAALATAAEHPWFGRGYGAPVAFVSDPRATGYHADWQKLPPAGHWRDGHDVWLDVLGQAGVLGLAAFFGLVALIARRLWAIGDGRARAVLAAALAGSFLYGGLFDAIQESRHLWPLVGLALAAARLGADRQPLGASLGASVAVSGPASEGGGPEPQRPFVHITPLSEQ